MSSAPFIPTPHAGGFKIAGHTVKPQVAVMVVVAVAGLLYLRSRQSRAASVQAAAAAGAPPAGAPAVDSGYSALGGAIGQLGSQLVSLQSQVTSIGQAQSSLFTAPAVPNPVVVPPPTPSGDPNATLHALVGAAYQLDLGRNPDASGLDYWTGRLAGGLSPQQFGSTLRATPEGIISNAYQQDLGRAADAGGRDYWSGRIAAGLTAAELDAALRDTAEGRAHLAAAPAAR